MKRLSSIYLASLTTKTLIYLAKKGIIVLLNLEKTFETIPNKYLDYTDIPMWMSF